MSAEISILCLGSGAALASGRLWSSLLIDGEILLDLPPTAVPQMHRLKQDLTRIDHIFISHLHGDHVFGLPFLLLEYCFRHRRDRPLYLIGPRRLEETSDRLCELAWPEMRQGGFKPHVPLRYIEVDGEGAYRAGTLDFTAIPMRHFDLDAFGYRFEHRGRTFGYTGDTEDGEEVQRLLAGVDVAIIERTHAGDAGNPGHLDEATVLLLTEELRRRGATVVATHIGDAPRPIDGLILCEDGATITI